MFINTVCYISLISIFDVFVYQLRLDHLTVIVESIAKRFSSGEYEAMFTFCIVYTFYLREAG